MNDRDYAQDGKTSAGARPYWSFSRSSGGHMLIAAADRLLSIGPTLGNLLFAALPLLAAVAAAA